MPTRGKELWPDQSCDRCRFAAWGIEKFPRALRRKVVSSARLTGYSTAGFVATILEEWLEEPCLPPEEWKGSDKRLEQWQIGGFPIYLKDRFIAAAWAADYAACHLLEYVLWQWFENRRRNDPRSKEQRAQGTTQ